MNAKKKAIIDRIKHLENAIEKAEEYLATGKHAHWYGFRPLFYDKYRDGKELPPHKDWIENVFLRRYRKALKKDEARLEKIEKAANKKVSRKRRNYA